MHPDGETPARDAPGGRHPELARRHRPDVEGGIAGNHQVPGFRCWAPRARASAPHDVGPGSRAPAPPSRHHPTRRARNRPGPQPPHDPHADNGSRQRHPGMANPPKPVAPSSHVATAPMSREGSQGTTRFPASGAGRPEPEPPPHTTWGRVLARQLHRHATTPPDARETGQARNQSVEPSTTSRRAERAPLVTRIVVATSSKPSWETRTWMCGETPS